MISRAWSSFRIEFISLVRLSLSANGVDNNNRNRLQSAFTVFSFGRTDTLCFDEGGREKLICLNAESVDKRDVDATALLLAIIGFIERAASCSRSRRSMRAFLYLFMITLCALNTFDAIGLFSGYVIDFSCSIFE